MPNIRHKRKNKRWWISENESRYVYDYAMMYNEWKMLYDALDSRRSIGSDGMPHGNNLSDPVEQDGIRREELCRKMEKIDKTLVEADPDLYPWLKIAVTNRGISYRSLVTQGMPCGPDMYYDRRRKFYYLLSKKI